MMNTESESRHERRRASWELVLAVAGTIGLSILGLALSARFFS